MVRTRRGMTRLLAVVRPALFPALLAALAIGAVGSGLRLSLPGWAVAQVEGRLARALGGQAQISLEGIEVWLAPGGQARLALRNATLAGPGGAEVARLPVLEIGLLPEGLSAGRLVPREAVLSGATVTLRRDAGGRFDVAFGAGDTGLAASGTLADVLDAVDAALAAPPLAGLERIAAAGVVLTFEDAVTGRSWRLTDGRLALSQEADSTAIALDLALETGRAAMAPADRPRLRAALRTARAGPAAAILIEVERIPAADLAAEIPALAGLGLVEAPISGQVAGGLGADGRPGALTGRLAIGAGAFRPRPDLPAIAFDRAHLAIDYSPGRGRIEFSEIALESRTLRLVGEGWAYPEGDDGAIPSGLVAQLRLSRVEADPEGLFAAPVALRDGALDVRIRFDPFLAEIGKLALTLVDDPAAGTGPRLTGHGRAAAGDGGWTLALDLAVDRAAHSRLLALWPPGFLPAARGWIDRNLLTGTLSDIQAAVRLRPGAEPRLALGYRFDDADVRVLPTLPPVTGGRGYALLDAGSYLIALDEGRVLPPDGGAIDVGGSVVRVPDVAARPSRAEVALRAAGSLGAMMALLHAPPFGLTGPEGGPLSPGEGQVRGLAHVALPLADGIRGEDVAWTVEGAVTGFRSTSLVPGHLLTADRLRLEASRAGGIVVEGAARLGELPFRAAWTRPLAPGPQAATVEGTVELSPRFARSFGLPLEPRALEGAAMAAFRIELPSEGPARFTLRSDAGGLRLAMPALGWAKPADRRGRIEVAGTLGRPLRLERIEADLPGLSARGSLALAADGGLAEARLDRVRLGDWFDGPVELVGRGPGAPPGVRLAGGTLDLRRAPVAGGGGAGGAPAAAGAAPASAPVEVALDRLVLTETLALTGVRAELQGGAGLSGRFSGRLNGAAPVAGTVAPREGRTAVRIAAEDAGAVLRAAGIADTAAGGALDLVLLPRADGRGHDGELAITGALRLREAPALATLLTAISVIGLLEQLDGQGLVFTAVHARFRLTPAGIEIAEGSAVGPSLGVSLRGVYATGEGTIDLQGVVSPLYMLNAVGGLFARRGEGLFGFAYRLAGPAATPRVEVNPLSILTPGMFREMFRAPPPTLSP